MRILVVNAGSSTLKLRVLRGDDAIELDRVLDPWDGSQESASQALTDLGVRSDVDAVGHRVVHGGHRTGPCEITDEVVVQLDQLAELAPLHQPRALSVIAASRRVLTGVPHVACFDTAFHATLPRAASTYALPPEWRAAWGLRRSGFHGLSHAWVARRAPTVVSRKTHDLRIVSCHLGAGASACAIAGGTSIDTTMGFTPQEGLVMATRSGSIDPGLLLWLIHSGRLDVEAVTEGLQYRSGLAGLSGTNGDMRDVLERHAQGDLEASLAFDVYVHHLTQHIAAMAVSLGGLDVLAFTGGVGEHAPPVRKAAANRLDLLGVAVDDVANARASRDQDISAPGAATRTIVIESREDLEIARQVRTLAG